ncbi:response regulator [bacterium]|nr:response regulator [bacterium]MCI0566080.1 response regulator [bacterium]
MDTPLEAKKDSLEENRSMPTILLVEDDHFLGNLLAQRMRAENLTVYQAIDVVNARNILEGNHVDAICLDVMLPGIDGFTFLDELKNNPAHKDIPVVIISNLSQKKDIDRGMQGGAAAYMVKANTTPAEISAQVLSVLKKKG